MTGFEALLTGHRIGGRYRIDALIGRGGMGAVYRALDERLSRPVAVKVVSPPGGISAEARAHLRTRFAHEARAVARLHHPNVVAVFDYGTDDALDLDFIVMELLHGGDLAARLARGDRPTGDETLEILRGAARGLAAGHRAGLIHRDVKPGNLFLCEPGPDGAGEVRVMDFGIAKALPDEATLTHLTQIGGGAPLSPAYAAPEQLRGDAQLTPACDVYALGAVGYELLTGQRALSPEQARRVANGEPMPAPQPMPDSALSTPLGAVLLRALAPEPIQRPPDAAALLALLDAAAQGKAPGPAPRATASHGPPVRARPVPAPADATRLVPCPECAHLVSPRARACPACGGPLHASPVGARRRWWVAPAVFLAGVLLTGAVAVVLLMRGFLPLVPAGASSRVAGAPGDSIAGDSAGLITAPPTDAAPPPLPPPAPRWVVSSVETDDNCGDLFNACLRVRCTIANEGDGTGTAEVAARLEGRRTLTRSRRLTLRPGERELLAFEFIDARNGERFERATCQPATAADIESGASDTGTGYGTEGDGEIQPLPETPGAGAADEETPGAWPRREAPRDTLVLP